VAVSLSTVAGSIAVDADRRIVLAVEGQARLSELVLGHFYPVLGLGRVARILITGEVLVPQPNRLTVRAGDPALECILGVRLEVDHTLLGGADTIDDGALMSRDDVVGASLGVPGSPWRVGVGLVGRIDHRVGDAIEGDTGAVLSGGTEQIHRGRLGGRHDDGSTVFVGSGYASGRI